MYYQEYRMTVRVIAACVRGQPRRPAIEGTISSTAGRVARPGAGVYALAKFGAAAFSESLRQKLIGQRVRVSVAEPGTVDTGLASAPA